MEVTKKVGDPDPSDPQGHPSAGSQQLGDGLKGSQGPWINSGSTYFRQGLSLSPKAEADIDETSGPASQAQAPEPIHRLFWDLAEVSSQCGFEQATQDVLRLSATSPFSSPIVEAEVHLTMENETLALPLCMRRDSSNDLLQHGICRSWLQVQDEREGKTPAKVLVGWGKGPSSIDQTAPLGNRTGQQVLCFPSEENGIAAAQDQGQGKWPSLAQAPPTPTQANTPALNATPVVEPHTPNPNQLTSSTTITNGLSQDWLREFGNQLSELLESSKVVACQDKVKSSSQEKLATPGSPPGPIPQESLDHAQELEVVRRQVLPKQPENPAEKSLFNISEPDNSTPVLGMPGSPKSQRYSQEISSSQPEKQPLNVSNDTCSRLLSSRPVTCHKQSPVQSPKEAMQSAPSSAPTCQLQGMVEDHVLVFDMATGSTRMGLLCHDPMGSRAVLVGLAPKPSSVYAPENMPSTQPLAMPTVSADSNRSIFWPVTSVLSTPVPSSLSSGSYGEVALVPKEAKLNLESQASPGTKTPIRVGMLTGPVPLGMPHQFDERTLNHVHDPGQSKPDAKKNEPSRTIWMLDASGMQDTSMGQAKKLQWMNSEPTPETAPSAKPQEAPKSLLQEDLGSHNWKEVNMAHPDNSQDESTRQAPLGGQSPLAEQHLLSEQPPPTGQPPAAQYPFPRQTHPSGQPPLAEQPPFANQIPFPGQPPLTGTPLAGQLSLTGQPPFSQELISKEPILSRGPLITREAGQASTLCQEGEALGLPAHVGVLRVPQDLEKACVYVSREEMGISAPLSSSTHWLSSWQPGSSHRVLEEQLSLITFTTPGTGYKVLPMAMVGTMPQCTRLKLTTEDSTGPSVVTNLGLLSDTYYSLPVQYPPLCSQAQGRCQGKAAVVIDTGTGFTKCGLAGEDHVLSVVPSRVQLLQQPARDQPRYVMPQNRGGAYTVLNRGVVSDWDALEVLWQHLFYCKLGMKPEELAVLVADSPVSPRTNREKVAEILFECFHVPAMQTVHQALLALYAYGRTTGLVLGSGHGTSYVTPILTGGLAPLDTYRLDVAGADLSEYLSQRLLARGHSLPEAGLVNRMKETYCYVALDMKVEMAHPKARAQVDFVLPDKQVITLGSERFCCPEALFQPHLLGLNQPGLPQLALLSISRLEAKQQEQLLANVVLDGGSTLLSGFPERLGKELGPQATVLGSPHRAVAAWLGGSIMASRDSFQSLWLSRREYEEEGPWAIYKYHL
ncbi:PREDICTED: uncharacterized protein LOC107529368 [Miniopterus natalensis]|uniref:uncharacterized protein LOC107529368 n=1 Tax=Miniopterus natalensis TaxID=291302 RepID=UPI0007A6CD7B|nr:PREDICTED: uncharacterized protein LOC107529368 [Miniopterus natalensis]